MTDDRPKHDPINALWFNRKGCGPDEFTIELHPLAALMDGSDLVAPPTLGLRIRAGDLVIDGAPMVDGGFQLDRASVASLHRQLGEWLESQDEPDARAESAAMTTTDKPSIAGPSRYHRFKQNDGRGYGILRLDAMGSNQAEVVDADLTEEAAIEPNTGATSTTIVRASPNCR